MATAEQIAKRRFAEAFGELPPIDFSRLTPVKIRRFNRHMRNRVADLLLGDRDRIADIFSDEMDRIVVAEQRRILNALDEMGFFDTLADTIVETARDAPTGRKKTQSENRESLREHFAQSAAFRNAISAGVDKARDPLSEKEFTDALGRLVLLADILYAESGARIVTDKMRASDDVVLASAMQRAGGGAFTEADAALLDLALGDIVSGTTAGKKMPTLFDAIANRPNLIGVPNFTDDMFDELKNTIRERVAKRVGGAEGARDLARAIGRDLRAQWGQKLSGVGRNKLMLWSRTEGVVIQNDAVLARGDELGMDGKDWQSVGDNRVRPGHVDNDAVGVIPRKEIFPDGSTDAGSGSVSPFNCFPAWQPVSGVFTGGLKARYEGDIVEIQTVSGNELACTVNHPVLTAEGVKFAGTLRQGDKLIRYESSPVGERGIGLKKNCITNEDRITIENVFETLAECGESFSVRPLGSDLYNDGKFLKGDVHIVASNGFLACNDKTATLQFVRYSVFSVSRFINCMLCTLTPKRFFKRFFFGNRRISSCKPSGTGLALYGAFSEFFYSFPFQEFLFGSRTQPNVVLSENAVYDKSVAFTFLRKCIDGFPFTVRFDDVVAIDVRPFSGHVYDLQSVYGHIVAGGIVTLNCRCVLSPALLSEAQRERDRERIAAGPAETETPTSETVSIAQPAESESLAEKAVNKSTKSKLERFGLDPDAPKPNFLALPQSQTPFERILMDKSVSPIALLPDEVKNPAARRRVAEQVEERMRTMLDEADIAIRVPPGIDEDIVRDGRFRTLFETGQSGGLANVDLRKKAEDIMFDADTFESDAQRPIYGYMYKKDPTLNQTVDQYGEIAIKLKPEVKSRTTHTFGDSLFAPSTGQIPSPVERPSFVSTTPFLFEMEDVNDASSPAIPYVEAQIHGGVALKDIQEIVYTAGTTPSETTQKELRRNGIPWKQE